MDDLIEGTATYDVKTAEEMNWSHLASKKGISKTEMTVITYENAYSLNAVLGSKTVKLVVVLITDEYYKTIAPMLKLANSPRCFHRGTLFLHSHGKDVILLDRREAWYLLPKNVVVASFVHMQDIVFYDQANVIQPAALDESCQEVCERISTTPNRYVCNMNQLQFINRCSQLKRFFPCERGCAHEVGQDLPTYVNTTINTQGYCLFSTDVQPLCDYAVPVTQRLCVCSTAQSKNYGFKPLVIRETNLEILNRKRRKGLLSPLCYEQTRKGSLELDSFLSMISWIRDCGIPEMMRIVSTTMLDLGVAGFSA